MGCLKSKPVPDFPQDGLGLVETVYGNSKNIPDILNDLEKLKKKTEGLPQASDQARYTAKFDYRVLAKYDIKALIGKGAYSRVVRVENRVTREPFAIKMVDRTKAGEMWEVELTVLRRVRHPNIIRLVEVFETSSKLYLVVELATGGELFERIVAKGYFNEQDSIATLKMILSGAAFLHSLGIAHRDLKPENLLYYHPGVDSRLLITDFGLSGFSRDGVLSTICGTPEFIAPEVLAKNPYTTQVDVWAIGVIGYILLSGTMPFDDDNRARLFRLILKAKYSFEDDSWKDISSLAKDFICRLLVVDANNRLTAADALKHEWLSTPAGTASRRTLTSGTTGASFKSSDKSSRSSHSNRSARSLRSDRRKVGPQDLDELHRDPEVQAELDSLGRQSYPRSVSEAS